MNGVCNMPMNMILYKKLDKLKIIHFRSKQPCTLIILLFTYKGVLLYYNILFEKKKKKKGRLDCIKYNKNKPYRVAGVWYMIL